MTLPTFQQHFNMFAGPIAAPVEFWTLNACEGNQAERRTGSAVSQEGPEAEEASAAKGTAVRGWDISVSVMLSSPPRRLCHMRGRMSVTG